MPSKKTTTPPTRYLPEEMLINHWDRLEVKGQFIVAHPGYYDTVLVFSPHALRQLLSLATREHVLDKEQLHIRPYQATTKGR